MPVTCQFKNADSASYIALPVHSVHVSQAKKNVFCYPFVLSQLILFLYFSSSFQQVMNAFQCELMPVSCEVNVQCV